MNEPSKTMTKILSNGCEGNGESIRTTPFKPVARLDECVSFLNSLYEGERDLFSVEHTGDDVIVHASTYLLSAAAVNESGADGELTTLLEGAGLADDLRKFLSECDWDAELPVADLINFMIAQGQSVTVQITDPKYGNDELVIEK